MEIVGNIDRCDSHLIEGWITCKNEPMYKFEIDIMLGNQILGHCKADLFREDLLTAGLGNGECAFKFEMPNFVPSGDIGRVRLRLANSMLFLQNPALPNEECSPKSNEFGGLWIDRMDWMDQLSSKHRQRNLSEEICTSIFNFVRDGFLIIPGAVQSTSIDKLNDEIDRIWHYPPTGLLVETFEPDGKLRYASPEISLKGGRTKMLDLYGFSAHARDVIAAPKVMEFLSAIFESTPKAFQSLTFWNGSQQAIHKDTAYVKIDTNTSRLVATWLALEDVHVGTGELEYFVGSHRAPDYIFGGKSKWAEACPEEHEQFLTSLHEDARTYGHTRQSFLAKKGDVLIWHADLAHGGSKITRKDKSRRSLVTHFTTCDDQPFYRRHIEHRELSTESCIFTSQYVDFVK